MTLDFQVRRHIKPIKLSIALGDHKGKHYYLFTQFINLIRIHLKIDPLFRPAPAILSPVIVPNVPATSKSTISKSESQTPPEVSKTPPTSTSPFLALPTNPIIIIPYSLIRNSSIIPGPL